MADNTVIHEQRRHKRKKVKITALLKMGMYLSGRGYAKDISRDGICLVAPNLFKFIKSSQLSDYIGAHIRIMFPAHSLTVTGTIVRIDTLHGEGALSITNTSNDEAWEQICSGG
ncbi:MAG: PilZ domain-containing protein [Desulfomonilia bacterium]|nr:PilZ domain-containing protein [Pseudomonadota bacterium]HON37317.1 PilZ domain-containing protein [Deltaproteobacteria bacterium]HRS56194.1 PilZ domain-containing protein [Desulfomonilia bacterium]HPD21416.1 PilZ domain-containing protein [Deltaproteobacteria bacterium]HPX18399.1 PilZ domain-containing protein [Deltaproteobacteria bacterium]